MKAENMEKLVRHLSKFIKTGDVQDSPHNTQYSWYIDIFLDENKSNKRLHIDRFSEELARRLIVDEQIPELDSNSADYDLESLPQQRYNIFYYTWYSWSILYDALHVKRGLI